MSGRDVIGLGDRGDGALTFAQSAADTFFFVDVVLHEALANVRRALLVHDMGDVFVLEGFQRGKDRVGRGLTESAERVALDVGGQFFQFSKVVHRGLSFGDLGQGLEHSLGTGSLARGAACELQQQSFQQGVHRKSLSPMGQGNTFNLH